MHVYADTWAHQGFIGARHSNNRVSYLDDSETSMALINKVIDFLGDMFSNSRSQLVDNYPLGHGPVLSYPDRPFFKWEYKDYKGELIIRDNT